MKRKMLLRGITGALLVFGLMFSACGGDDGEGTKTPELTGTVSVTGKAVVGETLTADTNGLEGTGSPKYQWKRSASADGAGEAISSETGETYTPGNADIGKYLTVTVSRAGYDGSVSSSAAKVSLVEFVKVPGGTFTMGNPGERPADTSAEDYWDGRPAHSVTLTGFYIGKYELTQAQYQAVMGSNPSEFNGSAGKEAADGEVQGKRPVEKVSWYDAVEFCNKLSELEGLTPYYTIDKTTPDPNNTNPDDTLKWTVTVNRNAGGYRLPTEAEWEYAARGGNGSPGGYTYAGGNDADAVAWYDQNSGNKTHEVGKKAENSLGLYDMSGNMYEWCWNWSDAYPSAAQADPQGAVSGVNRVFRGGSWGYSGQYLRSASRSNFDPSLRLIILGFRLVRP